MIWVLDVKALPDFRLQVAFSDGSAGSIDLTRFIFADRRPIVAVLRDPAAFATARVEGDTVVWANGFDLAPEFLHATLHSGVAA